MRKAFIFSFIAILIVAVYYISRNSNPYSNRNLKKRLIGFFESKNLDGSIEYEHYTFEIKANGRFDFNKPCSSILSKSGKWKLEGQVPYASLNLYFDNGKKIQINRCEEIGCIFFFDLPNDNNYIPFVKLKTN